MAQCTAKSKRTGQRCKGNAVTGSSVCRMHGAGKDSPARKAAVRRVQQANLEKALATYGSPRHIDPHTALLEEVRRTAGHVAFLQLIVSEIEQDRLVHGVTKTVQLPDGGRQVTVEAAVSVWVALYHTERRHLLQACRTAIQCGVEQRRVELEERHGELIADVFRHVYDDPDLGLSRKQRQAAMVATARHLRLVSNQ